MNIKRVVKYLELKSQLTAEELQMAETMVGLTESDKEALVGLLQPVKVSKPATKRVIERCGVCGATRRHLVHKDTNISEYHEFHTRTERPKRDGQRRGMPSSSAIVKGIPRCVACYEIESHSNHDLDNGGHEFTTDLAGRVNGVLDGHNEKCAHVWLTGELEGLECSAGVDANVHQLTTTDGYHEFVGGETAVGASGD